MNKLILTVMLGLSLFLGGCKDNTKSVEALESIVKLCKDNGGTLSTTMTIATWWESVTISCVQENNK
ncbi:hypothetical protein M0R04_04235 [Candidatus Dojkabacteria bacterium]|jgi:hypothetical protein|nr:hypothetical protein [Candidatus Dojkabacteria bacterium]